MQSMQLMYSMQLRLHLQQILEAGRLRNTGIRVIAADREDQAEMAGPSHAENGRWADGRTRLGTRYRLSDFCSQRDPDP
ncbi:hypothetical protein ACIPW9_32780 [Streptomyces sp. NPDC090052]|uniref:hypothetical protein n=1 Tax=unclassified Streptomyces TaxID=2593676 RepID=UPI002E24D876|nr:hypothetical protein OG372_13535 [Streptomyces sp. NBC_01020]